MKNLPIDWDSVPDVMNKDQFYRLCHISKSTALHLLKSGKVPCEWSGKKTRCYKIKKEDVRAYLEERAVYPELYSAPRGWYGSHYVAKLSKELPEDVLRQMNEAQTLTDDAVLQLLSEVKGNQVEYVKVPVDKLRSFFRPDTSVKQMTETLVKAMDFYNKHLARQRKDRDAR